MIVTMLGRSYDSGYTGLGSDKVFDDLVDLGKAVVDIIPDTVAAWRGQPAADAPAAPQTSWFEQNRELVTTSAIVLGVVVVAGVVMKKKRRR